MSNGGPEEEDLSDYEDQRPKGNNHFGGKQIPKPDKMRGGKPRGRGKAPIGGKGKN